MIRRNKNLFEKTCLGTANVVNNYGTFSQKKTLSFDETEKVIDFCTCKNIKFIDTALSYKNVDKTLGEIGVSECNLITKIQLNEPFPSFDDIQKKIELSLDRLKKQNFYGILIHNPEIMFKNSTKILEILCRLKDLKLTSKIGVSVYDFKRYQKFFKKNILDIVQGPYNLLDRRVEQLGFLDLFHKSGIEFFSRSIFLQGIILQKENAIDPYFKRWLDIFEKLNSSLNQLSLTKYEASLLLNYANYKVHKTIIGVDNLDQLMNAKEVVDRIKIRTNIPSIDSVDTLLIDPTKWKINYE